MHNSATIVSGLFIFEALLHLLMEKMNKRKRKAILNLLHLSSHRFAHYKKKKRFADSCG